MTQLIAPDRPDWRWARVAELSQHSTTSALALLKKEDELTLRAYQYKQDLDKGLGERHPELDAAHTLFVAHPTMRMHVEALLIAGADNDLIADACFLSPDVVELYHEIYFWVRPGLKRPVWINSTFFAGFTHSGAHHADTHSIALRLGWKLGPEVYIALTQSGLNSETARGQIRTMVQDVLYAQAANLCFASQHVHETPDWFRAIVEDKGGGKGSSNDDLGNAIDKFFDGMGISVADPTNESNLSLPAREERAVEYEVVSNAR